MALVFQCKTLRGNRADDMIENSSLSLFSPRWGMNRKPQFLAVVTGDEKLVAVVNIAVTPHGPALRVAEGDPEMEVVLVKEYMTGVGGKRWPGFEVNFSSFDGIRILSTAQTSGGSGWEKHTLLIAPLGWANSVSAAFVDQRDYGDQIISVNDTVTEEPLTAFGAAFNFKGLNN